MVFQEPQQHSQTIQMTTNHVLTHIWEGNLGFDLITCKRATPFVIPEGMDTEWQVPGHPDLRVDMRGTLPQVAIFRVWTDEQGEMYIERLFENRN